MPTDERIVDPGRAQVPNLLHELMFGDQAVSMPYEVGQNLQHLRLYVLRSRCAAQLHHD